MVSACARTVAWPPAHSRAAARAWSNAAATATSSVAGTSATRSSCACGDLLSMVLTATSSPPEASFPGRAYPGPVPLMPGEVSHDAPPRLAASPWPPRGPDPGGAL